MNTVTLTAVALTAAALASVAHADGGITSTLSATYYEVANNGSDPDFETTSTPNVAPLSALGPDGLPVTTAPSGISDVTAGGEITWWSPSLNSHVVQTGTGTITLPYASNMFAPNSTGTNDSLFFETAKFSGNFSIAGPGTVTFTLGSDDDTFLYVDNKLIAQNPGVHGVSSVVDTTPTLAAGSHTITLFYDDRHTVGAYLSLDSSASITPGVPEPAAWAMMLVGFGGLGALLRRRAATVAA